MDNLRRTRRALLGGVAIGSALVAGAAGAADGLSGEERRLAHQVGALLIESRALDYEDAAAWRAHHSVALEIIEAVIARPAGSLAALRTKAAALLWCYGGLIEPEPDAPPSERLVASMVRDLLGPQAG